MASDQRKHPNKRTSTQLLASKVIHATTELLEENGPQAVTIRAVAARAQVAPMSVYNHFGDKQGLLHAVVEERFAIMTRALRDTLRVRSPCPTQEGWHDCSRAHAGQPALLPVHVDHPTRT